MLGPGQADLLPDAPLLMCLRVALVVGHFADSKGAFLV
jgi:hypothetical protein